MSLIPPNTSFVPLRLAIEKQFGTSAQAPLWRKGISILSTLWEVEFAEYELNVLEAILSGLSYATRYHENMFLPPERADCVATHSLQTAALLRMFLLRSGTLPLLSAKARRLLLLSSFVHDLGEILGEPGSVDNRHNRESQSEDLDFEDMVVNGILLQLFQAADEGTLDKFSTRLAVLQQEISPTLFALKTSPQSEIAARSTQLIALVQSKLSSDGKKLVISDQGQSFLKEIHDAHALAEHESFDSSYCTRYEIEGDAAYWQSVFKSIDRGEGIFYFITNTYSPSQRTSSPELTHWFDPEELSSLSWEPSPTELVVPFNLAPSYILNSYLKYCESHYQGLLLSEEKFLPLTSALMHFKLSEACTFVRRGPDHLNLSIPKPNIESLRVEVLSPYWSRHTPLQERTILHNRILTFCYEQKFREEKEFMTYDKSRAVESYQRQIEKLLNGEIYHYLPVFEELARL